MMTAVKFHIIVHQRNSWQKCCNIRDVLPVQKKYCSQNRHIATQNRRTATDDGSLYFAKAKCNNSLYFAEAGADSCQVRTYYPTHTTQANHGPPWAAVAAVAAVAATAAYIRRLRAELAAAKRDKDEFVAAAPGGDTHEHGSRCAVPPGFRRRWHSAPGGCGRLSAFSRYVRRL